LFLPSQQPQQQQQPWPQQHPNQDAPIPCLCYCDQPIDPDFTQCATNHFCINHPCFLCSSPCAVALVDGGSIPSVLDMSFILVLMVGRKVLF
jgi:hypothetical protein